MTSSRLVAAAWKTGFVLDNVRLKVDAFDYLQLPFDIKEGIVGRIEVQVSRPADQTKLSPLHRAATSTPAAPSLATSRAIVALLPASLQCAASSRGGQPAQTNPLRAASPA